MIKNTIKIGVASLFILAPSVSFADEHSDKMVAAEKYLEISNIDEMMSGMLEEFKKNPQVRGNEKVMDIAFKAYDMEAVKEAMKEAMAKRFTLEEMNMLNEFYATPQGQSILKKMPAYMSDVMPLMQKEMMKSAVAVNQYLQSKGKPAEN